MKEALHLKIRKEIYKLLELNPGLNLTTISEMLNISVALADYHLHYMGSNELITVNKEGGYKRYYIKGSIGTEDKKVISLLRQELILNIILYFLKNPYSKPREIRKAIEISPSLLTYYLKKLVKYGIIKERDTGEKKEYFVVNEKQVVGLIIRYKPNILLKRFRDTWATDVPLSGKITKKDE